MKRCIAIISFAILFSLGCAKANGPDANTVYDPDPNHLWNRLDETLFARSASAGKAPPGQEYGLDEPDILYWNRTEHLLTEPSHRQALAALDEFINTHGEELITDPLKRALLQRDLWELFDWAAVPYQSKFPKERRELESRLSIVIHRLALTTNEVASLPDNYVQAEKSLLPNLPQGLFESNGDWVNLAPDLNGDNEIAPAHDHSFGGCSPFLVFMRTPGGRSATTNYLYQLDTFGQVWTYETNRFGDSPYFHEFLNFSPDLPQFPAGTEFALVRRMCVIDTDGNIVPTPIVVSIQKRQYRAIARPTFVMESNRPVYTFPMNFFEFRMQRAYHASLRAVTQNETDFRQFDSMGFDPFDGNPFSAQHEDLKPASEQFKLLKDCTSCHQSAGIYSVNSYIRLFSPRYTDPPKLFSANPDTCIRIAIDWKQRQFNWGLLQGLWNQEN
jgi:hypothetical protein